MASTFHARLARAAGCSVPRFTLLVLLVLTSIAVSSLAFPRTSAGQAWTATWTPKTAAPAGPRGCVDGAYDSVRGRVLIFGGGAGSGIGDVWHYDTSADQWTQLQAQPGSASDAAQPHSSANKRVILLGGFDATSGTC